MKTYVIGVCGPSCSGKTMAVEKIVQSQGGKKVSVINQDSYYFSGSKSDNYDIPGAIDFAKMVSDVKKLLKGEEAEIPIYDFLTHTRLKETKKVSPPRVLVLEGILIFTQKKLRDLMNLKVYISSYNELAFSRRLKRDVETRGRKIEEVTERYFKDVLPSSKIYVEPTECYSDIVLKNNIEGEFIGLKILLDHISQVLS